ncbi:MAG TPA: glycosyltransferase [Oculatellaceae cyanobacterium]
MPNFKVCLCFSDTGGGHRSAVDALEAAIANVVAEHPAQHVVETCNENIIEKTHPINRGFVGLYNYILRHHQSAMRYYYWWIETFRPNNSEFGYNLVKPWIEKFLEREKPDVLVSVHPMCNHYLARVLKDTGKDREIKLITVVTDPNGNFWRGWSCPEAEVTFVPNELGRKQLIEWGVPAERIRVVGMPVHPDFSRPSPISREDFLKHLRLDPNKLTVCLNSGWAGGGNALAIYRQLAKSERDVQVIFLCGHNEALYEQVKAESQAHKLATAVLPFHDRMADLMNAVDLMVTKAGGLTTFEALARKLPLAFDIITKPMPQEMGTVELLVEKKLAYPLEKVEDILEVIEDFTPYLNRQRRVLPHTRQLDKIYASDEIARTILSYCDPTYATVAAASESDGCDVEATQTAPPRVSQVNSGMISSAQNVTGAKQ